MTTKTIYDVDGESEALQHARHNAHLTFRFFWREVFWEHRRIVPALDFAAVKVAFEVTPLVPNSPAQENMWLQHVDFDGESIRGELINTPQWATGYQAGDLVIVGRESLVDWLYVASDVVHGGFTVDAIRAGMSPEDRERHDTAWGLDFGLPGNIRVLRDPDGGAALPLEALEGLEHPMSEKTTQTFEALLRDDPSIATQPDERGWLMLHHDALAGNFAQVASLLRHGADAKAVTPEGRTAAELARLGGWHRVATLLETGKDTGAGKPLWPIGLVLLLLGVAGLGYLLVHPSAGQFPVLLLATLAAGLGLIGCTGLWYFRWRLLTPQWGKARALDVLAIVLVVLIATGLEH